MADASEGTKVQTLNAGAMSLTQVVVQGISSVGPALTVFVTFQTTVALSGVNTPLIQIIDLFVVLTLAVTLIELARLFPSAGGYFTYVSKTLGPEAGFFVSWIYFLYSAVSPGILFAFLGRLIQLSVADAGIHVSWIAIFLVISALVGFIVYRGIEISAKAMMAIAAVEIIIVVALGVWGFLPQSHTPLSFAPFDIGQMSVGGLGLAAMFGIFTYMGWEGAAPLAEESKNPRRNIPVAVVISILFNCVLKVVCFWGMLLLWGVSDVESIAQSTTMPAIVLAREVWGDWWYLALLAIANSIIGVGIAFSIVSTRMWFAMGRAGALPRVFAKLHPTYRTPTVATWAQIALFLISGLGGAAWIGVDNLYLAGGLTTVFSAVLIYLLANIGLMTHMIGRQRQDFKLLPHLVMPALSSLVLLAILYKSLIPLPDFPMLYGPIVAGVWLLIGLAIVLVLCLTGNRRWVAQAGASSVARDDVSSG